MLELEKQKAGEAAVHQYLAMLGMLQELEGVRVCTRSEVVIQVKKSVIKRMNLFRRRKIRNPLKKVHFLRLVKKMFKMNSSLIDKRLLAAVGVMFCCIKRFSDIKEWRWEYMTEDDGGFKVVQPRSKTDQLGHGLEIYIPRGRVGTIGPFEILDWLRKGVGRPEKGFVFCSLRRNKYGHSARLEFSAGYDVLRKQFKAKLREIGLPEFCIHACRIGGATELSRLGVSRDIIKQGGNWKSEAVDLYIRPERPMTKIVNKLSVRLKQ